MTSKRGKTDFLELVKSSRRELPKPPRLLAAIQQNMVERCGHLLESMFLASDDAFYDFSKRATTNSEETLYFDSMREVRLKKQGIAKRFAENLSTNFNHLVDASAQGPLAQQDISAHKLSIMDSDALEVDLARKNMVSHARATYREPLYELNMRLDDLLPQVSVDSGNNPLDPHQIAAAFIDACSDNLELGIKARLVLFKLFEKHLLKQLSSLYADINRLMIEAGILPKVPRPVRNPEESSAPQEASQASLQSQPEAQPQPQPTVAGGTQPHFNLSLDALTALMAAVRGSGSASGNTVNCYVFTNNPGPVMSAPKLASLLTRSQLMADRQLSKEPKNIVPQVVSALLAKANADAPQALEQADETIINLVSMFFDEILADDNLPLAMHLVICRLQIPVLKVALQDHSFFSNHQHPVRQLINTVTDAGIGFDDNKPLERDPVYREIVDIVQTISREPKLDQTLFDSLHQNLQALILAEQRKTSIVEKRTNQSAAGRARIRNAKKNSQQLLYSKMQSVQLPVEISDFLTTAWLQVLIITQLKHGCDSSEWIANGHTVTDLIWLCQRHEDVRSMQRRERLHPDLMARIEEGLEAAIESPEVRASKVRDLQAALRDIETDAEHIRYQPLTDEQKEVLGIADADDEGTVEARPATDADRSANAELAEHIATADAINEGTWVEYVDDMQEAKVRHKLAAKIDPTSYVFVNRKGFKTLERSRLQLACDIYSKRAKPLASGEFFDRMMNNVVSQMKNAA